MFVCAREKGRARERAREKKSVKETEKWGE